MALIDIKAITEQARKEVNEEQSKRAVVALKKKLTALEDAKQIVRNIENEIKDLEASIADGTF